MDLDVVLNMVVQRPLMHGVYKVHDGMRLKIFWQLTQPLANHSSRCALSAGTRIWKSAGDIINARIPGVVLGHVDLTGRQAQQSDTHKQSIARALACDRGCDACVQARVERRHDDGRTRSRALVVHVLIPEVAKKRLWFMIQRGY